MNKTCVFKLFLKLCQNLFSASRNNLQPIILETRPEIVKFSPIIRECDRLNIDYFILHTGQHYSYNIDRVFFDQLELPYA